MTIIPDKRSACAIVFSSKENEQLGTAFLISGQYALTATFVVKNFESVILEFPTGRYFAKVETTDNDINCAVLFIKRVVEDVLPMVLGVDAAYGDIGYCYGFPILMEGTGIFVEGLIQEIEAPAGRSEKPKFLLLPTHSFSNEVGRGFGGSPLIVGNNVVGLLTTRGSGSSNVIEFLIFTRIQDCLELLPEELVKKIRPCPLPKEQRKKPGKPEVAVISALDEELDYLYELPMEWSELSVQKDDISYRRGHLTNDIDIIATSARSMGLVATGILTAKVLKEWDPSIAVMIGICGGRKEKGLNIGDIVLPNQCFHYQFGAFENGNITRELRTENTETQVIDIVEHLARRTQVLAEMQQSLPRGFKKPDTMLQCHIGPMASADLVVKSEEKFNEAIEADRKTIAVDMESYAFMRAARLANTRWFFSLKSVSDFADAKKDDEYREYAKFTSASFFVLVVQSLVSGWIKT